MNICLHHRTNNIITRRVLTVVISAICLVCNSFKADGAQWKFHPAFDHQAVRIIDSPDHTYFQVWQRNYNKDLKYYDTPMCVMLSYDKNAPEKGIRPLTESASVTGINVLLSEYSPEDDCLCLVYTDGSFDFVYSSGRVVSSPGISVNETPRSDMLNGISVSDGKAWISHESGFVVVDIPTGVVKRRVDVRKEFSDMAISGSLGTAIIGGKLYTFDGNHIPAGLPSFERLQIAGVPSSPLRLMALGNEAVAVMWRQNNNSPYSLSVLYRKDGEIKIRKLGDLWMDVSVSTSMLANPFEFNCIRNRDGWLYFGLRDVMQLHYSADPESSDILTALKTNRDLKQFGSWDMNTGWAYKDRGEFSPVSLKEGVLEVLDEESLRPNLPDVAVTTSFTNVPGIGVVTSNFGCTPVFALQTRNAQSMLLSAYKDGKWSRLSPVMNTPYSAETPGTAADLYNSNKEIFPMGPVSGVNLDPEFTDFVWVGSTFGGLAAIDIKDVKQNPVHMSGPSDPFASFPGFKQIIGECRWKGYYPFSTPRFDSDGTLWSAMNDYNMKAEEYNFQNEIRLYHITKEERREALEKHDAAFFGELEWIGLDMSSVINGALYCVPLRHPRNRNIVLTAAETNIRSLFILDHKGTLSDKSDDVIREVNEIRLPSGAEWTVWDSYDIGEDPLTGEVWISTGQALLKIDPHSEVLGGRIAGEEISIERGADKGNPFSSVIINSIMFDEMNRMWISTQFDGLWCISADRKGIEAHYTKSNSPLPSNTIYGMIWNPETASIFMSTDHGIMELWPDASDTRDVSSGVTADPETVGPEYAGNVIIAGLEPYSTITILDAAGEEVSSLGADYTGHASWNLCNYRGEKVSSGIYLIKGDFPTISLPVLR